MQHAPIGNDTAPRSGSVPAPATQMARLEARLERIEGMLSRFESAMNQAPAMLAVGGDIADEWARHDGRADARLAGVMTLLERLTQPEVLQNLGTIVTQLEAAPRLVALVGDILDEFARSAAEQGADLQSATDNLLATARAVIHALGDPNTKDFLESGALSGDALKTINLAARSLIEAHAGSKPVGFFGAMSRMRDPEVQRAVGFALAAAKAFGRDLSTNDSKALTRTDDHV